MRRFSCLLGSLACVVLVSSAVAQHERRHPLPALRVLVPAYFYPVPGSPWVRLTAAAEDHPGRVWAIGNPGSGPGPSIDPTYVTTFRDFRRASGRLLGYVTSSYGTKPSAALLSETALWFQWYGADGIFVDEMDNTPGAHEAYYHTLFDAIRAQRSGAHVVANPGTSSTLDYLDGAFGRCASALCLFENSTSFQSWTPDAWTQTRARKELYALPYGVSAGALAGGRRPRLPVERGLAVHDRRRAPESVGHAAGVLRGVARLPRAELLSPGGGGFVLEGRCSPLPDHWTPPYRFSGGDPRRARLVRGAQDPTSLTWIERGRPRRWPGTATCRAIGRLRVA